jgi:hypothetical protein
MPLKLMIAGGIVFAAIAAISEYVAIFSMMAKWLYTASIAPSVLIPLEKGNKTSSRLSVQRQPFCLHLPQVSGFSTTSFWTHTSYAPADLPKEVMRAGPDKQIVSKVGNAQLRCDAHTASLVWEFGPRSRAIVSMMVTDNRKRLLPKPGPLSTTNFGSSRLYRL